ncbi:restriction endonuclease [Catenuloplanes atrovinosus]|uniref:Restriction endonuclease type IV Mrr domain-containing protein n=1 Tax=Catenuloplanes atrovinosus TaxID=137266 RepID=A0AAE3YU65_9ACTN|nr:restriction endonuclease [Catenuloplanes atrovinosus]MDR7278702.1 hypothetical protein [Catenuloplanes atrovinosus]
MVSSDDAHVAPELDADESEALERYQRSISRLTFCFDERPHALYNRSLVGRLSGQPQAVEMLIWGPVVGQEVAVAIECDQGRHAVGTGAVERFAEKLVDIAADCGILYAVSGFTTTARARAARMRHPAIMPIALNRPGRNREPMIPGQRQPAQEAGFLPPHDAEEITEMDFMLYLWLRPGESV